MIPLLTVPPDYCFVSCPKFRIAVATRFVYGTKRRPDETAASYYIINLVLVYHMSLLA